MLKEILLGTPVVSQECVSLNCQGIQRSVLTAVVPYFADPLELITKLEFSLSMKIQYVFQEKDDERNLQEVVIRGILSENAEVMCLQL